MHIGLFVCDLILYSGIDENDLVHSMCHMSAFVDADLIRLFHNSPVCLLTLCRINNLAVTLFLVDTWMFTCIHILAS